MRQRFNDDQRLGFFIGEERFTTVEVLDEDGNFCGEFQTGGAIRMRPTFKASQGTIKTNVGFAIREAASRAIITVADAQTSNLRDVLSREGIVERVFENTLLRPNSYRLYLVITNPEYSLLPYDILDDVDTRFIVILAKDDSPTGIEVIRMIWLDYHLTLNSSYQVRQR